MKKILFLFILILSKNILGINKELKQAIENLNFEKTELLLERTYKSFDDNDKKDFKNLSNKIRSNIYNPLNIATNLIGIAFGILGSQVFCKLAYKLLKNRTKGRDVWYIPNDCSISLDKIQDFFCNGICWDSSFKVFDRDNDGNCISSYTLQSSLNIPMLGFSALSIYFAKKQITRAIKSIKIYKLLEKYINTNLEKIVNI